MGATRIQNLKMVEQLLFYLNVPPTYLHLHQEQLYLLALLHYQLNLIGLCLGGVIKRQIQLLLGKDKLLKTERSLQRNQEGLEKIGNLLKEHAGTPLHHLQVQCPLLKKLLPHLNK